jgi:hypothetical protein
MSGSENVRFSDGATAETLGGELLIKESAFSSDKYIEDMF